MAAFLGQETRTAPAVIRIMLTEVPPLKSVKSGAPGGATGHLGILTTESDYLLAELGVGGCRNKRID
jgi:hypothetical protein